MIYNIGFLPFLQSFNFFIFYLSPYSSTRIYVLQQTIQYTIFDCKGLTYFIFFLVLIIICYNIMQSNREKLWKQIGAQYNQKQLHNAQTSKTKAQLMKQKETENQYNFNKAAIQKQGNISFDMLQISQIKEEGIGQVANYDENQTKNDCIQDNLQNMLMAFSENANDKNFNSPFYNKKPTANQRRLKSKFKFGCKLFLNILNHLKEQIGCLQKLLTKQHAKFKQLKTQYENSFIKILYTLNEKVITLEKQMQQKNILIQKLNKIQRERIQTQKKLKLVIVEKDDKYHQLIIINSKKQAQFNQKHAVFSYEKMLAEQKNLELEEKIFELQQKMSGFQLKVEKKAQKMLKNSLKIFDCQLKKSSSYIAHSPQPNSVKTSKTLHQSQFITQKSFQEIVKSKMNELEKTIFKTHGNLPSGKKQSSSYTNNKTGYSKASKFSIQHQQQTCPDERGRLSEIGESCLSKFRKNLFSPRAKKNIEKFKPSSSFQQQNTQNLRFKDRDSQEINFSNSLFLQRKNYSNINEIGHRIKRIQNQIHSDIKNFKESVPNIAF